MCYSSSNLVLLLEALVMTPHQKQLEELNV